MNIAVVANHLSTISSFRSELITTLLDGGSDVYVLVPGGPEHAPQLPTGVHLHSWDISRKGTTVVRELRGVIQLRRILADIRPHVVLTYTVKPNLYTVVTGLRRARRRQIATVTGLGSAIMDPTAERALRPRILRWLYRQGLGMVPHVFFQNEQNMRALPPTRASKAQRHLVAGSGVNLEVFAMAPYPELQGELRIVVVSRIRRDKGIRELISAMGSLAARSPTLKVIFDIIGWPEDAGLADELRALEKAGLCSYSEGLPRDAVIRRMAAGHALAHFSHHEGLSNVILEASAIGRPVIAPDIAGCREAIARGRSGLLFTAGSDASAIDTLVEFLGMTHSQRREMGVAARALVERRFDRRDVVRRYVDAIRDVASQSGSQF